LKEQIKKPAQPKDHTTETVDMTLSEPLSPESKVLKDREISMYGSISHYDDAYERFKRELNQANATPVFTLEKVNYR
jgi:hypothetical protein